MAARTSAKRRAADLGRLDRKVQMIFQDSEASLDPRMVVEDIVAEVIAEHSLPTPLVWIEHYPEHEGEVGEWSLVRFSSWETEEVCLKGAWRHRVGSPNWSPLYPEELEALTGRRARNAPLRPRRCRG